MGETTGYDNKSLKETIDELGYSGAWEREGSGSIANSLTAEGDSATGGLQEEVR